MKKNIISKILKSPIVSFIFVIAIIIISGTLLQASDNNYLSVNPQILHISNTTIEVSWDRFPEANESTHYQVLLNHTFFGHSTKGTKQICNRLKPGAKIDVKVATYHNGNLLGISSSTPILMAPAKPTLIKISEITTKSFRIQWDKVDSATSYGLYLDGKLDSTHQITNMIGDYKVDNLEPGKLIKVSLTAINESGQSPQSDIIDVQLAPVASLTVSIPNKSITATSFDVEWTKQENATAYKIIINDKVHAEVASDTLKYSVTNLEPGTTVSLKITVENVTGSDSSEAIIVQLKPDAPTLSVTEISSYSCTLTWSVANGANNYKIFENGDNAIYNLPSTITTVTITENICEGLNVKYKVRSVNDIGESEDSNIVEVTYSSVNQASPTTNISSATAPIVSPVKRLMSTSYNVPTPSLSDKIKGTPIIAVYFPKELKGPELALEVEYLEMLAQTKELSHIKFFAIFTKHAVKGSIQPNNLFYKKSRPKDNIKIPGKLPLVRFFNEDGKLENEIIVSIPILTVSDIYKELPSALDKGNNTISLYHEQ